MNLWRAWIYISVIFLAATTATRADVHAVTNNNSHIFVDPSDDFGGMINWFVDGSSQLVQQWNWFRIDGDPFELSLNNVPLVTDTDNGTSQIALTYAYNDPFKVDLTYNLTGGSGGSGFSKVVETLTIYNTSAVSLNIHWFEFDDFDLSGAGNGGDDSASGGLSGITQFDGTTTVSVTHLLAPDRFEIAAGDPFAIFDRLEDTSVTNLGNTNSPSGPDDITFAFQWDLVIAAGDSVTITTTKLIPEPSTAVLTGLALGALLLARRRRS